MDTGKETNPVVTYRYANSRAIRWSKRVLGGGKCCNMRRAYRKNKLYVRVTNTMAVNKLYFQFRRATMK